MGNSHIVRRSGLRLAAHRTSQPARTDDSETALPSGFLGHFGRLSAFRGHLFCHGRALPHETTKRGLTLPSTAEGSARVRADNTVVDHGTPAPLRPLVPRAGWHAEVDRAAAV